LGLQTAKLIFNTRKPCCRKETARCRSYSLKIANDIHYKLRCTQAFKLW